jgi:gliding motility-associated-like protein
VTQTGTTGGSYSAIPNVGLSINPTTGEINPSLSSPGIYNVVYGLPGSICTVGNPSAQVEILALPTIVQPAPVAACYNFTLPSIAVGNYFSQTGGIGPLDITQPITNSQAIYIYAVGTNGCINEKSFAVTINSVPTPTFTTTESACSPPNGTITVISPTSPINPLPTDLFISAVTDEPTGNLTYVELFNGTGAPINLSNYKLKFTYFGGLGSTNSTFPLTGTINNNTFKLVKISNDANATGVIPDLSCTTCSGVNTNDNISLQRTSGSNVDVWGTNNGTNFTPGPTPGTSTVGYTYQRKNNVTIPSTTWNPNDWTAIDVVSGTIVYTSVLNKFTLLPVSNYQFAVDGGPFQNPVSLPVTFTGLAAGNHTLVVKDVITGCLSDAVTVPINLLNPTPIVTGFSYPASVCQNGTNPLPGNFATGFTPGGTYSEDTNVSTGLVFVSTSSGEIDLINSTPGNHTIKYTVLANPLLCLEGGESSATIEIKPKITPIIGFSYPASICKNAQPALLTPSAPGLSSFAIFSANPAGLIFTNTSTGIIDLANSTPGIYNIVVDVIADSNTCRISATTSPPVQLEIKPVITLETGFNYDTPFCSATGIELPNLNTGFATGGIFSSTNGLIIDPSTGAIDLTSTPGQYTITYNVIPNSTNCEVAPPGTTQIMIVPPVTIEINGGCQSINYILTATPVNGSFIPETASYSWQNAAGIEVGTTQSITVTEVDVYTVTITVDGCSTESLPFDVTSVSCVIQKGISVNNDDLNDTFDLSGFDVKNLTIFNRLGMKVYTRNDYVDEWGGKSDDGDELPDGTYYYVIQQRSGTVKTGWIYINRAQ